MNPHDVSAGVRSVTAADTLRNVRRPVVQCFSAASNGRRRACTCSAGEKRARRALRCAPRSWRPSQIPSRDYACAPRAPAVMSSPRGEPALDAGGARRLVAGLRRAAAANAEARARHAGRAEAVAPSEMALHDAVAGLAAVATEASLLRAVREAGVVEVLCGLLGHSNVDIVSDVLAVLVDFVDPDGEEDEAPHKAFVGGMVEEGVIRGVVDVVRERLGVAVEAMDEEDRQALGAAALAAMSVFENAVELRPDLVDALGGRCGVLALCVEEVRTGGGYSERRAAALEVLALLLQTSVRNRLLFASAGGVEVVLTALAPYLQTAAAHGDEEEMVANLFGVLCAALAEAPEGKEAFHAAEGVALMVLFVHKRRAFREPALKALDFACSGSRENTAHLFAGTGVAVLFSVLSALWTSVDVSAEAGTDRRKRRRRMAPTDVQRSEAEHFLSVLFSMYRYGTAEGAARLAAKFAEHAAVKARQLLIVYADRLEEGLLAAGEAGSSLGAIEAAMEPSDAYVLQLCAVLVAHVCVAGGAEFSAGFDKALENVGGLARVGQLVERFADGVDEGQAKDERRRLLALSSSVDQLLMRADEERHSFEQPAIEK